MLDFSSFENALATLGEALDAYDRNTADLLVRDACIQRFEYCYELSHKTLRRFLEATEASKESIDSLSFPDVVRLAGERGLIAGDWQEWKKFRDARNITAHTYDAQKAMDVLAAIPSFYAQATALLKAMKGHANPA